VVAGALGNLGFRVEWDETAAERGQFITSPPATAIAWPS
jgi:hypothetical protein